MSLRIALSLLETEELDRLVKEKGIEGDDPTPGNLDMVRRIGAGADNSCVILRGKGKSWALGKERKP